MLAGAAVPTSHRTRRFLGEGAKSPRLVEGGPMFAIDAVPTTRDRDVSRVKAAKKPVPVGWANPRFLNEGQAMNEELHLGPMRMAFREAVLRLGGVFAAPAVDDALVGVVARELGKVVDRHISEAAGRSPPMDPAQRKPRLKPHPAIAELLTRIGPASPSEPTPKSKHDPGWLRLPGLFRRWEFEQVIDVEQEFLVEEAGHDEHGMSLYAIFSRPQVRGEGAP